MHFILNLTICYFFQDLSFYDTSSANPALYGSANCSSNEENSSESIEYNMDIQNVSDSPRNFDKFLKYFQL